MTEKEWLESPYVPALAVLQSNASDRKLRLFACACCNRILHLMNDPRSKTAVEVAERFADGLADLEELARVSETIGHFSIADNDGIADAEKAAYSAASRSLHPTMDLVSTSTSGAELPTPAYVQAYSSRAYLTAQFGFRAAISAGNVVGESRYFRRKRINAEHDAQSKLCRDIFGNPFRPVTLDPRWQSSTVLDLARTIYDQRTFETMPILGDALMDAGCDSEEIIKHCQGSGPHVRGCWVVDLILGRS